MPEIMGWAWRTKGDKSWGWQISACTTGEHKGKPPSFLNSNVHEWRPLVMLEK